MKALQDLDIFVRTVETGSLSATARALDLTPAAASAALKRLEAELGAALFVRSTRSLRLTPRGEIFLEQSRPALQALQQAARLLAQGEAAIEGALKLSAPSDLGRNVLLPLLEEFQQAHPRVQVRLQLSDRVANLYSEPVDAAFRYGEPPDSTLVALPLAPDNRRVLCASPEYLKRHGEPASLQELSERDGLCFMFGETVYDRWHFAGEDGKNLSVRMRAVNVSNDGDAVRRWAILGRGIAYKAQLDVQADLTAGRLRVICPQWSEPAPLYMVVPDRRQLTPLLKSLRDHIAQGLVDRQV
ncbi:LysR family transcriptional regulator [Variovorax sp. PCZ-1]|uniref:LysR family transcriptional regulator n=1 Tax=Variovorax sp. PCZ-1 TaxID=2835533 RepID=UPI001BCE27A8|nr:LysR family transcriptional regulator [Variovorax sp. PCZ-1]MBS7809015.1 LysR family transcriptional regulator [Variovorax sp. PCZ-1]